MSNGPMTAEALRHVFGRNPLPTDPNSQASDHAVSVSLNSPLARSDLNQQYNAIIGVAALAADILEYLRWPDQPVESDILMLCR
jgi:hypothetical protein